MYITVEISYYALVNEYAQPVEELLVLLKSQSGITVSVGGMSTLIGGEYEPVMQMISSSMKQLMEKYPSVFTLKIANACSI